MNRRGLILTTVGLLSTTGGCVVNKQTSMQLKLVNNEEELVNYRIQMLSGEEVVFSHRDRLGAQTSAGSDEDTFSFSFSDIKENNSFRLHVKTENLSSEENFTISCRPDEGGAQVTVRFRNGGIAFQSSDCRE